MITISEFFALIDYIERNFLCIVLMSWPGLCESDNIKRMITVVDRFTFKIVLFAIPFFFPCKKETKTKLGNLRKRHIHFYQN